MIVIGITGSVGTGKSTVTRQFAQCGALTFDSDAVVHSLLGPGGEAVGEVAALFPTALEWGSINRRLLGAEVFGSPTKRKALEAILHPQVRRAQDRFIRKARRLGVRMVVLDVPLLFETGGEKRCDITVLTTAPLPVQKRRVLSRAHMTQEKFKRILAAQMPDAQKRKRADFIINTGLGKNQSLKAIKRILQQLSSTNDDSDPV